MEVFEAHIIEPDSDPKRYESAHPLSEPVEDRAQALVLSGVRLLILGMLFVLPLCFGGAPHTIGVLAHSLVYLAGAALLVFAYPLVHRAVLSPEAGFGRIVVILLSLTIAFCGVQFVWLAFENNPHPVLGASSGIYDYQGFLNSIRAFGGFVILFIAVRTVLYTFPRYGSRLCSYLSLAGVMIALVALAHWFSDNGLLFWTFEPKASSVSDRARWPFVSPNNLAHFLIPLFFMSLSFILAKVYRLQSISSKLKTPRRQQRLSFLLSHRQVQGPLAKLLLGGTGALAILMAILATLSRGGWLATGLGLIAFVLFSLKLRPERPRNVFKLSLRPSITDRRHRRHRRARIPRYGGEFKLIDWTGLLSNWGKPFLLGVSVLILIGFLSGRGSELIEDRLVYGLQHSKEDIRWQFISDTWPMLSDNLLFGIGLGNWRALFPAYMSEELVGLTPFHLHSDPLQLLVEIGLVGFMPLALLLILIVRRSIGAITRIERRVDKVRVLALSVGLLGVLIASLFDFPFRLTSVLYLQAVLLALLTHLIDNRQGES